MTSVLDGDLDPPAPEHDEPGPDEDDFGMDEGTGGQRRGHRAPFDKRLLREPLSVLPVRKPIVLAADCSVTDAIRAMQREHRGVVLITEDGTPESALRGIFTERDVLLRVTGRGRNPATLRLSEVMTENPERLIEDSSIAWVLNKMHLGGFRHVPVVDTLDRPVFVISVRDVVEFLVEAFPREVLNLPLEYGADRQRDREGA
ncbi:MAG TPA: CBS domain-containing protein [Myxococcota bacterium]|nr:CBS domain-containing protein [Myxococcota bacterium]